MLGDGWVRDIGGGETAEANVQRVPVKLTPAQRRIYKEFEQRAVAWLGDHPVSIDIPATLDLRLRQATLGDMIVSEDGEVTFSPEAKSSKITALLDILSDLGEEPVIVYTHSKKFLTPLIHQLREAGYDTVSVSSEDKTSWREFRDGQHQILCAVIPAIAEGVDGLQNRAHVEIWLSQDNSLILNEQAKGRLSRQGQKHTVTRYLIEAENTVDTRAVVPRLNKRYKQLKESGLL